MDCPIPEKGKLRLDEVQEFGKNNLASISPYIFTYEGAALPHTLSYSQDPWGVAIEQEVVADKTKLSSFELKDRFTYNGKELQGTLNYLDYCARMYDATIGRWGVVDPLALLSCNASPYNFVKNDPINYIDLGGLFRFPKEIRKEFPYSVSLLRKVLSDLSHAPALKESIKSFFFEGVDSNKLREDFTDDKGPEIHFASFSLAFGQYTTGNEFSLDGAQSRDPINNTTYEDSGLLQEHLLNRLEHSIKKYKKTHTENDRQEMRENLLLTTVTIMHEYIHLLDNRKLTPRYINIYPGDDKATPWERRITDGRRFQSEAGDKNITPKQAYREKRGGALLELMFYINSNTSSNAEQKEVKRYTRNPGDDE